MTDSALANATLIAALVALCLAGLFLAIMIIDTIMRWLRRDKRKGH